MRRPARSVLLTTAIALLAGLVAMPTLASDVTQSWQQHLKTAREAKSHNDWDTANAAYARALAFAEESFGSADDRVARTLEEISRSWLRQWDKARAVEAQARAIEIRQATDQPSSTAMADALHALGRIHQRFGEPELAEDLFRRSLERREAVLGPNHTAVSTVVRDLSEAIADVRPEDGEAEELLKRTVAIDETPANLARVADYYAEREEHDLALDEFRAAIALEESRPMPRLSELVSLWARLSDQHLALERYDEAEVAMLTALELREEHLGPDHPYLAFTLKKLAAVYIEAERYVEAEGHLLRAEGLNEAAWGHTNHHCGCNTASLLEQVNEALGRGEGRTADSGREAGAKADVEENEEDEDPLVAKIEGLEKRAEAERDKGDIEAAIATMREALALRGELHGADSVDYAYGIARVAMLLRDQRRYDEAADVWQERLRLLELNLEPTDPQMISSLGTMGLLTRMKQDYDAAESFYRRELRARIDVGQNLKVARTLEALGNMNLSRPDPERAADDFMRAAERWEKMAGIEAPEIIRIRALHARALIELDRFDEAELILLELLDREQGKRYPDASILIQVLQQLKTVFESTDRAEAASGVEARLQELRELRRAVHTRDERVRRAEDKRAAAAQRSAQRSVQRREARTAR